MISFAMPWLFGGALAAALAITALHFLSVRQPRVLLLPTARFVPERDARAVARQAKPSDLLLLLLRVIALLAAGAAAAGGLFFLLPQLIPLQFDLSHCVSVVTEVRLKPRELSFQHLTKVLHKYSGGRLCSRTASLVLWVAR